MLTPEQLAAIMKATGRLPPGLPLPVQPPSPQLPPAIVFRPAPMPATPAFMPLVTAQGQPTKEPRQKRGRPAGSMNKGLAKLFARPTGLSQAKGVSKEVERYLKDRLDWLVLHLHQHYVPCYHTRPGCMSLVRRDINVSFDGFIVYRAPSYPDWWLEHSAQCHCHGDPYDPPLTAQDVDDDLRELFMQHHTRGARGKFCHVRT